jgi:Zn-dependent protease
MGGQVEVFRISGIPIVIDFSFILLAVLWTYPYWTAGSSQMLSAGFIMIVGIFLSILLHELGHAWTGRWFGVDSRLIELNGMGGICVHEKSLPGTLLAPTVVYLAGPFANLLLWQGCKALAASSVLSGYIMPSSLLYSLASINFILMVFNLMPAFPLDGGRVLDVWLARLLGPAWSVKIVAGLGFVVVAGLVYLALPRNFWTLLVALSLFQANYQAWQSVSGNRR